MKKKVLLIANPIAGMGKAKLLVRELVQKQEEKGCQIETFFTRCPGDATRRARSIESDVEALVVAGGDGTLNEVVNGLTDPSRIPVAVLPLGTANILAHELALPDRPEAVADAIDRGCLRWLDMGLAGDRRFLMLASAGIDAIVTEEVQRSRGKTLGYWGYFIPVLKGLARYRLPDLRVTVDGYQGLRGAFVLVSKVRNYGGFLRFTDRACFDSGHFDVCIFRKGTVPSLFRYYVAALLGRASREPDVTYLTGKCVQVDSEEPVAVQIDGDPFGTTPVQFRLEPCSVPIVVPPSGFDGTA